MPTLSYPSYPPSHICTDDGKINILQLTDLHLYLNQDSTVSEIENSESFIACLNQALSENRRCDLILMTGDLVNVVNPEVYQYIFQTLQETGIAFACIAGNHDVTDELGKDLPYSERQFVAHEPNPMLLSRHCIRLNDWQLYLIDSSVAGKVYGEVGNKNLNWLSQNLANSHFPVIIAMHHHVLPMKSAWIDNHITQDREQFWHLIKKYDSVKAVVNGHVHQLFESEKSGIKVLTTPSTCYQFKPGSDEFALDEDARPGYRWLILEETNRIQSWITRLEK